MCHSGLLIYPYLYFFDTIRQLQLKHIWQITLIWQKKTKNKNFTDWLADNFSELAENEQFWRSLHIQSHKKISLHSVHKSLPRTPAESLPGRTSRDIPIPSLVLWHTRGLRHRGQRKPQRLMFVFVQQKKKEREREKGREEEKDRQHEEKQIFSFLEVTNHIGQETFVFSRLDCTMWNHEWQFHRESAGQAEVLVDSFRSHNSSI